ncbi:sulfatase-like hydrolase/transferase [Desertimonas flava]|uniref:sulfatase-like hydrolase/transferase n=1 Tax=Desertimonas flava TaxID=2064846 RepID=UPI0013C3F27D|nr:sulfatase-like hydrolase/transferase [Desertimonas flava]
MNETADGPTATRTRSRRRFVGHAAGIVGLCGVAIAQPVFTLLGEEPTYFVVHGIEGRRLLWFAIVLIVAPPLALILLLMAVRVVSTKGEVWTMTVLVGILTALTIVPAIDREFGLPVGIYVALTVAIGVGVALAYTQLEAVRRLVLYFSPAPILFLALFLISSPSSALLRTQGGADMLPTWDSSTPVTIVVFDEFALGVLLGPDGDLDTEHFPNFGRLAEMSTWYPNATTAAFRTDLAVPSILSGRIRPAGTAPTVTEYPRSLFSMLGASYDVRADEVVTRLCPDTVCATGVANEQSIVQDTAIAYLHGMLPDGLADAWLPPLGARWGGFADQGGHTAASDVDESRSIETEVESGCTNVVCQVGWDRQRFESFLAAFDESTDRPQLLYHHALLPHVPYRYFPNGVSYEPISVTRGLDPMWIDDSDFMDVMRQRYFLQSMYVDSMVGSFLDRLEATSMLDDALVVVLADHGVSLDPATALRGPEEGEDETRSGVHPIPMFVKLPGQQDGVIDERQAQNIDVLPTVADVLDLDLPSDWVFDGQSLLEEDREGPRRWLNGETTSDPDPIAFGIRLRSGLRELPGRADFIGVGPYGDLIGRSLDEFEVSTETKGTLRLDLPSAYDDIDPSVLLPALLTGSTEDLTDDDWLAITIDGTIAGVGPVYRGETLDVLLDPQTLTAGHHDVRAFAVDSQGSLLIEVSLLR